MCDKAVDLWDTDRPAYGQNGTYGDYLYFSRAVETIENHSRSSPDVPLFFYMASQVSHDPVQAPARFQALYDQETCPSLTEYAMSAVLDEGIGNLTSALKRVGFWNNTILVFSSGEYCPVCFLSLPVALTTPTRCGPWQIMVALSVATAAALPIIRSAEESTWRTKAASESPVSSRAASFHPHNAAPTARSCSTSPTGTVISLKVIVKTMLISTCIRLTLVSRLPSLRLFLQRLAMTGIYHAFCDS